MILSCFDKIVEFVVAKAQIVVEGIVVVEGGVVVVV